MTLKIKRRSLIQIILVGLLLVGLVAAYLYFWQSRPIGSGPAGPFVPPTDFSSAWSEGEFLLVGLGDSVTAGFGARKGYSYFDRLIANPPDEFAEMEGINLKRVLPRLTFTNLAVSGSTSIEHFEKQWPLLPRAGSNVTVLVVLTTGGNDLIHNYGRTPPKEGAMFGASWDQAQPWIAGFRRRLDQMIEKLNQHYGGKCRIFLANIYDPTDAAGDIQRTGLPAWPDGLKILAAYNGIIRETADRFENVQLVDLYQSFLGHGIHCTQFWSRHYDRRDPHYWYYINLEDPNERGYDAIRRIFLLEMTKSLKGL